MFYALSIHFAKYQSRYFAFLLSISFILGFQIGAIIVSNNADLYSSLIYVTLRSQAISISLFVHIILTFSLTALVCYKKGSILALVLCFLHSFVFGTVATAVYFAFGTAQSIIGPMSSFTGTVLMISFIWFWIRNITFRSHSIYKDFAIALCASTLAAVFDICVVSPFVFSLFS